MTRGVRAFAALFDLEWRRRRPLLGTAIGSSLALWIASLLLFPGLRDGSLSADLILLVTALTGSLLAADAFASDARSGGLEFFFAQGAPPAALFLARAAAVLAGTCAVMAALLGPEALRLRILSGSEVSERWLMGEISFPAARPREVLLLYLLPALSLFLLASAVSSRTTVALFGGGVVCAASLLLDRAARPLEEMTQRQATLFAFSAAALVPAAAFLAVISLRARRTEPDRTGPRTALAGFAALALSVRFLAIAASTAVPAPESALATEIAVSPDGSRIAIEAAAPGAVTEWEASAAAFLGTPVESLPRRRGSCVVVASLDGPIALVSPFPARLADPPVWTDSSHLRLRGIDPFGSAARVPLTYDAERRTLTSGSWPAVTPRRERRFRVPAEVVGEQEIAKLDDGRRLVAGESGTVDLLETDGARRRLWPPLRLERPRRID